MQKTSHEDSQHITSPRSLNIPQQSGKEYFDCVWRKDPLLDRR